MKDNPTTRRPPAGLGIDDPDPLGSGAALARPEARATPTHEGKGVVHSPLRRCETLTAHVPDHASRARQSATCAVPGRNAREKCGSTLDSTQRARPWGYACRDLYFAPSAHLARPRSTSSRTDLSGRTRRAAILEHATGRLPHRRAVRAARMPRPEGAQSIRDREGARGRPLHRSARFELSAVGSKNYWKKALKRKGRAVTGCSPLPSASGATRRGQSRSGGMHCV